MSTKILVADDDANFRKSIIMLFTDDNFSFLEADTLEKTYHLLNTEAFDLLLLDVHFGSNQTSLNLIKRLKIEAFNVPIIVLSGEASSSEAILAIKNGAHDFLEKPLSFDKLKISIDNCLNYYKLKNQVASIINSSNENKFIGISKASKLINKQIEHYGSKDIKVLITGETGTGKEIVSANIYKNSARKNKPYLTINVSAIPENLIESELFGHTRGSFTGATSDQMGKLEIVSDGTIFLDEIGDLTLAAQNKLLRFLESDEIQKVGSSKTHKVNVRVIAATSRDLEDEIKHGRFRSDLYYRLNVARIEIPPLKERIEDIPILFNFFLTKLATKHQIKTMPIVDDSGITTLQSYSWPGNVRELRNIAERIILQEYEYLDAQIIKIFTKQPLTQTNTLSTSVNFMPLKQWRTIKEKEYIEQVLQFTSGSITKAAEILSLDRTYLHQLLKKLNCT